MSDFSLLFAYAEPNLEFGYKNHLPWYKITEDLKEFSRRTRDAVLIMGRRTYESLPPLKRRDLIVVTHSNPFSKALETAAKDFPKRPIFVIGGIQLLEEAILHPNCTHIYCTRIYTKKDTILLATTYLSSSFLELIETSFQATSCRRIELDQHVQVSHIEFTEHRRFSAS